MPMYEYNCLICDRHFDLRRRMDQDDSEVACPRCGGREVQRRLSLFAAHSRGTASSMNIPVTATAGGGCGPGCCGGSCATRN